MLFASQANAAESVATVSQSCVIPDSGPWPPCATGGNSTPTNSTNNQTDCVIPTSGPWPPCATNGGASSAPAGGANTDSGNTGCVIPESGPWPPCATNGGGSSAPAPDSTANSGSTSGCVIPTSGPWPPCATGGSGGNATPAPAPVPMPNPAPQQETATKTHTYSLFQAREIIMDSVSGPDGSIEEEPAFKMEDNLLTLTSSQELAEDFWVTIEFSFWIRVVNGDVFLACNYIDVTGQDRIPAEECQDLADSATPIVRDRFKADFNYQTITSIVADGEMITVTYR